MNEIKIHKIKISKIKPLRTHLLNLNGNISASGFYGKKKGENIFSGRKITN